MTSISAMRFDRFSGAMACDEARTWNHEELIFLTAEKIRLIVPEAVTRDTGLVAMMGKTGSSTLQDEWIDGIRESVTRLHARRLDAGEGPLTMEGLAWHAWDVITESKRLHTDHTLRARFGFTAADFVRGAYTSGEASIPIADPKVIEEANRLLTWETKDPDMRGVWNNSHIVAGLDPVEGFRLFLLSFRTMTCDAVGEVFLTEGSGQDATEPALSRFANDLTVPERRGAIDRLDGVLALLEGLNRAVELTTGVDGYYCLYLFDGREELSKRLRSIEDARGRLAGELVRGGRAGLLDEADVRELVDRLVFGGAPFSEVNALMLERARDRRRLVELLRGYALGG